MRPEAGAVFNVYTLRYNYRYCGPKSNSIGIKENQRHLAAHNVTLTEFEHVLNNDPLDLDYGLVDNEERHRSVGLTSGGRVLSVVWAIRNGKVRAITAFPSSVADRKAFLERS